MDVKDSLNKRSAERYTYLPQAKCITSENPIVLQVRDISLTGLQFFSNIKINPQSPLSISWTDELYGSIDPFVVVTRQISQPHIRLYQYCYGSQFINLRNEARESLIKVVKYIEKDEIRVQRKIIQHITSESLLEIIQQGRSFIQSVKTAKDETFILFSKMMRSWKEYEIDSFEKKDEHSQWIQKLTATQFHCTLLKISLPVFPINHPIGSETFRQTAIKLDQIPQIITEATKFLDKQEKLNGESSVHKIQISESINRLSYRRFELLKTLIETITTTHNMEDEQRKALKKIMEDYSAFISNMELNQELMRLKFNKSKFIISK